MVSQYIRIMILVILRVWRKLTENLRLIFKLRLFFMYVVFKIRALKYIGYRCDLLFGGLPATLLVLSHTNLFVDLKKVSISHLLYSEPKL